MTQLTPNRVAGAILLGALLLVGCCPHRPARLATPEDSKRVCRGLHERGAIRADCYRSMESRRLEGLK